MLFRCLGGLLALGALPALAQAPPAALPRLLAERRVLTERYAAARTQHHALFGLSNQPSRQDLRQVVDALQGIVDKDEQIVAVLDQAARQAQTTASTLQSTGRDDRNLTTQRLAELQNELQNAHQRARQAAARQQALAADLAEARRGQWGRDAAIAVLALALALAGVGLRRRR